MADAIIQNRGEKDRQSTAGQWASELASEAPWFKDVVLNVHFKNYISEQNLLY